MTRLVRHRKARANSQARATPERGARPRRVWSRAFILPLIFWSFPALSETRPSLPVPSGQPVHLSDVLLDDNPGELWVRFRFIAPKIGYTAGRIGIDVAAVDMEHLCQTLAIAYVKRYELEPARVVISLSDRPIEFGHSSPDATQFFEEFLLQDTQCVWDGGI